MIPFLAAATFAPPATAPASGMLTLAFPGSAITASMGLTDSIAISFVYSFPGEATDYIDMFVTFNGGTPIQWGPFFPANEETYANSATYNSTKDNWQGAGTYQFSAIARRVSSGAFDVPSNIITLTVS